LVEIKRTHYARQIDDSLIGQQVRVGGWIEDVRDIGKLAFVTIRDVTGACQLIVVGSDNMQAAVQAPRQSAVVVAGAVQKSKAKDFPVEIRVTEFTVLTRAANQLPIDPTGRVESAIDKRLDARALDLRTQKVAAIFKLRSAGLQVIRNTLHSEGFIEVNTPKIIGSASEGGANLFGFDYFGKRKAYLAQSPQLYKEQLTLGLDRIFEIGPYFRAENSHTVRHLTEFTSVDIEAAFLDYEDVMDIAERVVRNIATEFREKHKAELQTAGAKDVSVSKIDKLTYEQCLEELSKEGENIQFGDDLSDAALRKLGEIHRGFYFIIDWPLALKPFYIHEKEDSKLSKSFDLQYGYLELISGGRRLHDPEKLKCRLMEQGLNPSSFSEHLKAFDWGMPPHSGWGLGYDRLMMVLTGSQNVRDVVLYPRDSDRLNP
jgi:nondiscriminating aspartyl-tRNA synthetase